MIFNRNQWPGSKVLLSMLMLLTVPAGTRAGEEAEARAIVERAVRALGGGEKLNALKAATWKSKGTFTYNTNTSQFLSHWSIQGARQYRKIREEKSGVQTVKSTLVVTLDRAWFQKPKGKLAEFHDTGVTGFHEECTLHWMALRLDFSDKAFTLSRLPASEGAAPLPDGVHVTHRDLPDTSFDLFFDHATGLLTKLVTRYPPARALKENTPAEERTFGEYKEFGGIKFATIIRWSARYGANSAVQTEERFDIQIHDKLDDSVFQWP